MIVSWSIFPTSENTGPGALHKLINVEGTEERERGELEEKEKERDGEQEMKLSLVSVGPLASLLSHGRADHGL